MRIVEGGVLQLLLLCACLMARTIWPSWLPVVAAVKITWICVDEYNEEAGTRG